MAQTRWILLIRLILGVAISGALIQRAGATTTTITFDDLGDPQYSPYTPHPDALLVLGTYAGFIWSNDLVKISPIDFSWGTDQTPGFNYGAVPPGGIAVYNQGGKVPASIRSAGGTPFIFNGAFFSSATVPQLLAIEGYNDGVQIFSTPSTGIPIIAAPAPGAPGSSVPVWVGLDWAGVDEIRIRTSLGCNPVTGAGCLFGAGHQWVMDNFTYTVLIPEPSSAIYLLAGTGLLLGLRMRRGAARRARS